MADFRPTQWPPEKWLPEKGPSPYKMGLRQILDREGETAVPTGWQPYMSLEMDVPPPQIAKYTIYFQCWKAKSWRHSSWLGTLHLPNVEASSQQSKSRTKAPPLLKNRIIVSTHTTTAVATANSQSICCRLVPRSDQKNGPYILSFFSFYEKGEYHTVTVGQVHRKLAYFLLFSTVSAAPFECRPEAIRGLKFGMFLVG